MNDIWLPEPKHDYSVAICGCADGPYLGARKSGTPECCEVCGFMTPGQAEAIAAAFRGTVRNNAPVVDSRPQV